MYLRAIFSVRGLRVSASSSSEGAFLSASIIRRPEAQSIVLTARPSRIVNMYRAVSWVTNALVDATPISGPAWV